MPGRAGTRAGRHDVGVYVCRHDLRGLLQRQRGTTRVLTGNTEPPLLFGPCHDITSSSLTVVPGLHRVNTSRARLLHSDRNRARARVLSSPWPARPIYPRHEREERPRERGDTLGGEHLVRQAR